MFVVLKFQEKNGQDGDNNEITLLGQPEMIATLPEGTAANQRVPQADGTFSYYIDCGSLGQLTIEKALDRFKTNYKHDETQRFAPNAAPEQIPAIQLLLSKLHPAEPALSKGVASSLPKSYWDSLTDSVKHVNVKEHLTVRNGLFAAAGVAVVGAAVFAYNTFGRSSE